MVDNTAQWTSEAFFERLDSCLQSKQWTIYRLCQEADISTHSIYAMRKRKSLPTLQTLCVICDALDVTVSEFLNLEIDPDFSVVTILRYYNVISEQSRLALLAIVRQLK